MSNFKYATALFMALLSSGMLLFGNTSIVYAASSGSVIVPIVVNYVPEFSISVNPTAINFGTVIAEVGGVQRIPLDFIIDSSHAAIGIFSIQASSNVSPSNHSVSLGGGHLSIKPNDTTWIPWELFNVNGDNYFFAFSQGRNVINTTFILQDFGHQNIVLGKHSVNFTVTVKVQ
ncbi:hypothetical protein AYI92_06680 [Shewanella xiamenensis]|uniref:hypothetical protein n=1 Tax=Shewanella xiamenensis TaxID=332186 RepID=UPI0011870F8E|nr:hypothetical protein [Shewanella xiamenensis]TVL21171.1 hypothetical protein AYI90_07065 [Shewanella xiamenensis]TVL21336.1 hypothetical protein AYI91_07805 [Shewanella xiamenensis]TVL27378.1 hypothetical protein AYI92_06680 [Shewanella xiamenensis]TVL34925.1 hypothetical protein AYI93_07295 [Shewanella xiamenensis]TVL35955.1 hypothetical protein AYI95_00325 [Shewanella xiamenensis]